MALGLPVRMPVTRAVADFVELKLSAARLWRRPPLAGRAEEGSSTPARTPRLFSVRFSVSLILQVREPGDHHVMVVGGS
jgi:hypothetical protein